MTTLLNKITKGTEGQFQTPEREDFYFRVYSDGGVRVTSANSNDSLDSIEDLKVFIKSWNGINLELFN